MKVKIRITYNELLELVKVVGALPYGELDVTDIEYLNLKSFYVWGLNKINGCKY